MTRRARALTTLALAAAAFALPASAWAHAALLRTSPSPSVTLNGPPPRVSLSYSEAVEPRFAIVSVTDAAGRRVVAGPPRRSPADPDTLLVPLQRLGEGWYLVYWRVISVDGHPVRGAFTFAVGPNAGPAPEFAIPSLSETATTPGLLTLRWIVFLSVLSAIGLLALRIAIARPLVRRVEGTRLRALSIAFLVASGIGLVAIPVYVLAATAQFALRSVFAVGALVPLVRASAFGRGYVDLELCFALFVAAACVALWVDRPERPQRSVAELLALGGVVAAAAATLLVPGAAGHAAQTSPRGLAVALDWLHLVAAAVWVGGLTGLIVLWRSLAAERRLAGLAVAVPRFSAVALCSVLLLIASGTWATVIRFPTLASLWQTSYGQALLVKIGLLTAAVVLAAVNLLRTRPQLAAAAMTAPALLRRLVTGETILVVAAVFAAAVLTSLAPPAKAIALASHSSGRVGPGAVKELVERNGYRLQIEVAPNRAAVPNDFSVGLSRAGVPVRGADVTLAFDMLDMAMTRQAYHLSETAPGLYAHTAPALVMVGHWGLSFDVRPKRGRPFSVVLLDHATG